MRYVALLMLVACGGDDGATVDAPSGDASLDAAMRLYGSIYVIEARSSGMNATLIGAGFGTNTTTIFSTRDDGPCRITRQTNTNPGPTVSAGTVSISGGGTPGIALPQAPPPDNTYFAQSVGFRYAANDMLTLTATGATVPAFSSMVTFPATLTVTSPTALSSLSKAGLSVAWTPTTGTVQIAISQYGTTPNTFVACDYEASSGTATIAASALTDLSSGQAGFSISTVASTTGTAGGYELSFNTYFQGFKANVMVQP